MNLARRLDRLEAHLRADRGDEPTIWREIIYDPREWDIGEEDAIVELQFAELDRVVATR